MVHFGTCAPSPEAARALRTKTAASNPIACEQSTPIRLHDTAHPWPVRDQFGRGTCVSFATIAAIELLSARRDDMPPERLSEQYLHERMLTAHPLPDDVQPTIPEGGVLLQQALQALGSHGVIPSAMMPYKPFSVGPDGTLNPPPPDEAIYLGQSNTVATQAYGTIGPAKGLPPAQVDTIVPKTDLAHKLLSYLQEGLPVVIGLPLFQHASGLSNWTLPNVIATGVVPCPEDDKAPELTGPRDDGHVVCLTGFEPDATEPLGGWFIFRNSWGLEFADHAKRPTDSHGPDRGAGLRGYGMLSATHVNTYCWEYLVPATHSCT
ncbi:C1 family peptidase [Pseudooctadecabacter jejudonensis]|uniref:Papain family cysteine protease n=1 Tax=Pseudooctadecabacter jejudonensis TaxID=1391910 RepID=A0A1Y5TDP4_9RHOB|nr:C1 family peptidase [Pseudooctadecabacter jejudonensis]SLN61726.1 hypothetical protein PSJ8397_03267 [Pseudooctadecabacter jejudonensis]